MTRKSEQKVIVVCDNFALSNLFFLFAFLTGFTLHVIRKREGVEPLVSLYVLLSDFISIIGVHLIF